MYVVNHAAGGALSFAQRNMFVGVAQMQFVWTALIMALNGLESKMNGRPHKKGTRGRAGRVSASVGASVCV